jgi:hypothetical protein
MERAVSGSNWLEYSYFKRQMAATDLVDAAFYSKNAMAKIDYERGKFISCQFLFRGDITPKEVFDACLKVRDYKQIKFVDWSPTGNNL